LSSEGKAVKILASHFPSGEGNEDVFTSNFSGSGILSGYIVEVAVQLASLAIAVRREAVPARETREVSIIRLSADCVNIALAVAGLSRPCVRVGDGVRAGERAGVRVEDGRRMVGEDWIAVDVGTPGLQADKNKAATRAKMEMDFIRYPRISSQARHFSKGKTI
jgi:hypothetical protein